MNINLLLILGLAFLHLHAAKLPWLQTIPPRQWHSFTGGVAIAYVFIDILPGLSRASNQFHQAYSLALLGLLTFYGLETLVVQSQSMKLTQQGTTFIFWIHIGTFAIYNALLGFLLSHTAELWDCLLLFGAIALHYLGNDYNLREHHHQDYDKQGRWVLAGAILSGWVFNQLLENNSMSTSSNPIGITIIQGFLAGGVIFNVLKSELPQQKESCFLWFLVGVTIYSTILLSI